MGQVWESGVGLRATTAAEDAQRAVDDAVWIDDFRERRRREFRDAAHAGIKAVLGTTKTGEALVYHQINIATRAQQLQRKEALGTITAEEQTALDALDAARDVIEAWRAAENVASAALDAAGTDEEQTVEQRRAAIEAVTPTWPE